MNDQESDGTIYTSTLSCVLFYAVSSRRGGDRGG